MLAFIIIAFVGYALALLFAALFGLGLLGVFTVAIDPRGVFARTEGSMTRLLLFVCGPAAIVLAALTRALA